MTQKTFAKLHKAVSSFLIAILLIGKIIAVTPLVYAEDAVTPEPTQAQSEPAPTSPPVEPTTAPTSAVIPTNAPTPTVTSGPGAPPAVPTAPPQGGNTPKPSIPPVGLIPTLPPVTSVTPTPVANTSGEVPPVSPIPSPTGEVGATPTPTEIPLQGTETSKASDTGISSSSNSSSVNDPANTNTGAGSSNTATEKYEKSLAEYNKNMADVANKLNQIANTGFNTATMNTLSGNIFTGDANSMVNLLNKLNSNVSGAGSFSVNNIYGNQTGDIVFTLGDAAAANGSFSDATSTVTKNATTGADSTNTAKTDNGFTIKEANGNDAKITNDVDLNAITGANKSVLNTGDGVIKTGDANAVANIINLANTNLDVSNWLFAVINIFGSLTGNIVLPTGQVVPTSSLTSTADTNNSQTGANSDNTAVYQTTDTKAFENVNTAAVATNVDIGANSGENSSNGNTGGGYVKTGNADANLNTTTVANTNVYDPEGTVWIVMVNELGKWVGKIIGAPEGANTASNLGTGSGSTPATSESVTNPTTNSQTGEGSTNLAENNSTTSDATANTNNAEITNNIKVNADTGHNSANYNTGAGIVETGDAKAAANVLNLTNLNVKAKKFVVLFVNVLGDFVGNIVTPGQPNEHVVAEVAGTTDSQTDSVTVTATPTPTPVEVVSYVEPQPTQTVVQKVVTYVTDYDQKNVLGASDYYYLRSSGKIFTYASDANFFASADPTVVPTKSPLRGVYLSDKFYRATESSIAGMLFGGVSLNVNEWWLTILPIAAAIVLVRRHRRVAFMKLSHEV